MSTNVLTRQTATVGSRAGVDEPLLTEGDLARRWRCSIRKVQRIAATGQLPVTHIGRSARFAPSAVAAYEARTSSGPAAPICELGPGQDGLLVVRDLLSAASTHLVAPGCFRIVVAHLKGGQAKTKTVFLTALELADRGRCPAYFCVIR